MNYWHKSRQMERNTITLNETPNYFLVTSVVHQDVKSQLKVFINFCVNDSGSLLFVAGHRQVISRIGKGSQNILIYNFIITTFDCQGDSQGRGISARAFAQARPGVVPPLVNDYLT